MIIHTFLDQRCCLLGPADCPALGLARVSGHDVLIPVQQPVVPITLLVDPDQNSGHWNYPILEIPNMKPDIVTATSRCWRWCLRCCCGRLWSGGCGD